MYQVEKSENKTGECKKLPLTEPFRKVEIPANATDLGLATIGTNAFPGLGVNVAMFYGKTPAGGE